MPSIDLSRDGTVGVFTYGSWAHVGCGGVAGSSDSDRSDSIRQALEGARDALPITRWRPVVQALHLRPEQVWTSAMSRLEGKLSCHLAAATTRSCRKVCMLEPSTSHACDPRSC